MPLLRSWQSLGPVSQADAGCRHSDGDLPSPSGTEHVATTHSIAASWNCLSAQMQVRLNPQVDSAMMDVKHSVYIAASVSTGFPSKPWDEAGRLHTPQEGNLVSDDNRSARASVAIPSIKARRLSRPRLALIGAVAWPNALVSGGRRDRDCRRHSAVVSTLRNEVVGWRGEARRDEARRFLYRQ
jgi:hypothetical protein